MAADKKTPTTINVLAQVQAALEAAGLDQPPAREPLALFKQLLNDWYYSQHLGEQGSEAENIATLIKHQSQVSLKKALHGLYDESLALSNAQGTLTIWTRRELDTEYQRLQSLIDNQHKLQQRQG